MHKDHRCYVNLRWSCFTFLTPSLTFLHNPVHPETSLKQSSFLVCFQKYDSNGQAVFLLLRFWNTIPLCVPLWLVLRNTIAMATPPIFPFLYLPCPKTLGTILGAPKRQIGSGSTFTKASSSERASHLQKRRCSTFTSKTSQKGGLWYLTPPQTLSNPICKNGIYNRVFFCRAPYMYIVVVPKLHRLPGFWHNFG